MYNQTKYLLQRSEDLYTTDPKLRTLFPHCANLYEYKKQPWITYQQIYEVNLEYRLKELRKYQENPELLTSFNSTHQTSYTTDIIKALAWTPFIIYSTRETLESLSTHNESTTSILSDITYSSTKSQSDESESYFPLGQPNTPINPTIQQHTENLLPNEIISRIPNNRTTTSTTTPTTTLPHRHPERISTVNKHNNNKRHFHNKHNNFQYLQHAHNRNPLTTSILYQPPPPPISHTPLPPPTPHQSQTIQSMSQYRKLIPQLILQKHNEIISQQYNPHPTPDTFSMDNIHTLPTPQVPSINEILQNSTSQPTQNILFQQPLHQQAALTIRPNIPNSQDDFYHAMMEISKIMTHAQQQPYHTLSPVHITTQPTTNTNNYHQSKKHKIHHSTSTL